MKNQEDMRKGMLAKIHIAKVQLSLDDDVYRDLLEMITGLRSCAKMNKQQLENVLTVLKQKGFQSKSNVGRMPLHLVEHRSMFNKLAVLLKQVGKTWTYADGMAKNMFEVERVSLLNGEQLHSVVAALQIYANRYVKGE